jgi:hypothetical protein
MVRRPYLSIAGAVIVGCSSSSDGQAPQDAGLSKADASTVSDASIDHASGPPTGSVPDAAASGPPSGSEGGVGDSGAALPVLTVDVAFPPASYTLQETVAPLVISWTSAVATTCTPSQSGPAVLSTTSRTATAATYANPTAPGSYAFSLDCATPAGYSAVAYNPAATSTTTVNPSPPCASSQLSNPLGTVKLTRQCDGDVAFNGGASTATYDGPVTDLATVLAVTPGQPQPFPAYGYSGFTPTFTIASGSYVALAIHVTGPGSLQFVANSSYGVAGLISLSTVPGALTAGAAGVVCAYDRDGSNNLGASTMASSDCPLVVGQTYFVNFAGATSAGAPVCPPHQNGCAEVAIAYTLYEPAGG